MNKTRESGYYWVKTKRTKVWMIARWWQSLNKGKGFWDTMATIENDTRGGFIEIDEHRIIHKEKITKEKTIKRTRRNKNEIKVHRQRRTRTHN
jgi:hypothetical protein